MENKVLNTDYQEISTLLNVLSDPLLLQLIRETSYEIIPYDILDRLYTLIGDNVVRYGKDIWICDEQIIWQIKDKSIIQNKILVILKQEVERYIQQVEQIRPAFETILDKHGILSLDKYININNIYISDEIGTKSFNDVMKQYYRSLTNSPLKTTIMSYYNSVNSLYKHRKIYSYLNPKTRNIYKYLRCNPHEKFNPKITNIRRNWLALSDGKNIKLDTKEIIPRVPKDYFTWHLKTNYNPDADIGVHQRFFNNITDQPDILIKLLGHCLIGKRDYGDKGIYFMIGPQQTCDVIEKLLLECMDTEGDAICGNIELDHIKNYNSTVRLRPMKNMKNKIHHRLNLVSKYDPKVRIEDKPLKFLSEGSVTVYGIGEMRSRTIFLGPEPPNINIKTVYVTESTVYLELKQHNFNHEELIQLYDNKEGMLKLLIDGAQHYFETFDRNHDILDEQTKLQTELFIKSRS